MKEQIEVEVRGKITEDFDDVLDSFKEKAEFLEEKDRFSLIYFRDGPVDDVSEIKDEKVDLRVRVTNKKAEIVMKHGTWGGNDSRKEILIPIDLEKFADTVDFLKCIDWDSGVLMATKTYVFNYKGVEFALVNSKELNYFEAEKIVENQEEADKATEEIKEICKEVGLGPFAEEQFIEEVNKMNNAPGAKFDLKKQNFKDIKEEYKEFF